MDTYLPKLEFLVYPDELRKGRGEVIEPLITEGLAEARQTPFVSPIYRGQIFSIPPWSEKYASRLDSRDIDPYHRVSKQAQRAAKVRSLSENADARFRARSASTDSSKRQESKPRVCTK